MPDTYSALGPQCPLLARKFPPETAEAVLRLLSDCKSRLKILLGQDCAPQLRRRLHGMAGVSSHEVQLNHHSSLSTVSAAWSADWLLFMQVLASAPELPDESISQLVLEQHEWTPQHPAPAGAELIDLLAEPVL